MMDDASKVERAKELKQHHESEAARCQLIIDNHERMFLQKPKTRDGTSLLIAGILLVAIVYLTRTSNGQEPCLTQTLQNDEVFVKTYHTNETFTL